MYYVKFSYSTPYCGTNGEDYEAYEEQPTAKWLDEEAEERARRNAESYEYLVSGWDDEYFEDLTEEEQEEELNNYYADCDGCWEEVSEEEYLENT